MSLPSVPVTGALVSAAVLFTSAFQAAPPPVVDLGTLGGALSLATAINDQQQVVGYSVDATNVDLRAFLWEDGVMRALPTLDGFSVATDINDLGVAVGNSRDAGFVDRAVRWQDGGIEALETPPGAHSCGATAVNNHGAIVGVCDRLPDHYGVLWQNGAIVDLGSGATYPVAIDDQGVVTGFIIGEGGSRRGFMWREGEMTDLGPLNMPFDLNERGQIAGWSETQAPLRAMLWERGAITVLPLLPGTAASGAEGINRRGELVGWCNGRAAVWAYGQVRELPWLDGGAGAAAVDINDLGVAVGNGTTATFETHAMLWPKTSTRIVPPIVR